jgi:hypothetical protein
MTGETHPRVGLDWTGPTQPRAVEIDSDMLHLGTVLPIAHSGKTVNSRLSWKSAKPN